MTEITLEQRVVLAVAWLCKAERLARGQDALSAGDLPPGYTLAADDFIVRQCTLARQAIETLEAEIEALRRSHADAEAIASFKRSKLPARVADGKLNVRKANETAAELARSIAASKEAMEGCDALLREIRSEKTVIQPDLPLFQYALTWRDFQEDSTAVPHEETATHTTTVTRSSSSSTGIVGYWRRMDRSDRIALALALLVSAFILTGGFFYMYVWGRLTVEIIPIDRQEYTVRFVNTYGEPIALQVPYDGSGLPDETPALYGVFTEITGASQDKSPLNPISSSWFFKDQPADLYGPILLSPVSSEELTLRISPGEIPEGDARLRLFIYKAPHRRYAVKTIRIPAPPAVSDIKEEDNRQ